MRERAGEASPRRVKLGLGCGGAVVLAFGAAVLFGPALRVRWYAHLLDDPDPARRVRGISGLRKLPPEQVAPYRARLVAEQVALFADSGQAVVLADLQPREGGSPAVEVFRARVERVLTPGSLAVGANVGLFSDVDSRALFPIEPELGRPHVAVLGPAKGDREGRVKPMVLLPLDDEALERVVARLTRSAR